MTALTHTADAARVKELVALIAAADEAYAAGDRLMIDAEYDTLRDELAEILADHPNLTPENNPLDGMWEPAVIEDGVRHARPMLSLAKIAPAARVDGVTAFMAAWPNTPVIVMVKLDGVSCSIVYHDGELQHVATRGTGVVGENITTIAGAVVRGIPETIPAAGTCEIRGEIVMLRSTLASYNQAHPGHELANARNAAAGVLHLKDQARAVGRELDFIAFDLDMEGRSRATAACNWELQALGFTAVKMGVADDPAGVLALVDELEQARTTDPFDSDGAVVRLADLDAYQAAGERSRTSRGAVAVKYKPEEKVTTLLDVVWPVGPGGKLPPRAVLDRVFVGGTNVTSATLSTPKVVRERGLMIGQRVRVCRRGEVIPCVEGPAEGDQPDGLREIVVPTHCPSCAGPLTAVGNSDEVFCTNLHCPAQGARRLAHWASRSAADMDAVGPVWVERLYEAGLLRRPEDFYTLQRTDLLRLPGMGEVSADRMLESIGRSRRHLGLRRAMIAFGIRHAREGTAKRLALAGYESVEQVAAATADDLERIPDIGPAVSQSIVAFFARPETQATIAALRAADVNLDVLPEDRPVAKVAGAPLANATVVITGAIAHPDTGAKVSRDDFARLVSQLGATVASGVSTKTTMLICGANVGAGKTGKAEALNVRVVDQAEIWGHLLTAGLA